VVAVRTPSLQLGVLQLSPVEVSPRSLPLRRSHLTERSTDKYTDEDLVVTHHRPHSGSVRDTRYINTKFHRGVTRTPDNRRDVGSI
jgi:hypothetical protein